MKVKFFSKFILVTTFCFISLCCGSERKISKGNEAIAKIEDFRSANNKLPNSLSDVGIEETESGPIHYVKKSNSKYILWFGKELGESVVYDSDIKQWK